MGADQQSEYDAAEEFEGKRVPFSGSGPLDKLDFITGGRFEGYRGENKYTTKNSYSIKLDYLKKCERLSRLEGQKMFMRIDFNGQKYIVIRQDWFQELF